MNRRNFLKALGYGAAASTLPMPALELRGSGLILLGDTPPPSELFKGNALYYTQLPAFEDAVCSDLGGVSLPELATEDFEQTIRLELVDHARANLHRGDSFELVEMVMRRRESKCFAWIFWGAGSRTPEKMLRDMPGGATPAVHAPGARMGPVLPGPYRTFGRFKA